MTKLGVAAVEVVVVGPVVEILVLVLTLVLTLVTVVVPPLPVLVVVIVVVPPLPLVAKYTPAPTAMTRMTIIAIAAVLDIALDFFANIGAENLPVFI